MPRVNSLVDVLNWCSLDALLPLGLYDLGRIEGNVTLRAGRTDDGYEAISNRRINLDGRYLLADDKGAFGSPMTDSKRTTVDLDTASCAIFVYAPEDYDPLRLQSHADLMVERVQTFCDGEGAATEIH